MNKPERIKKIKELIKKYQAGNATPEEIIFIERYYDYFETEADASLQLTDEQKSALENKLLSNINAGIDLAIPKIIPLNQRRIFRRLAAAAIIILFAGGAWLVFFNKTTNIKEQVATTNDIAAPTTAKVVLTLANGTNILLDSASSQTLAMQGKTKILKTGNDQIVYSADGEKSAAIGYNTFAVSRGGGVASIVLSDGSKVWLNSESSLTYPVVFTGNQRTVTISGEAYFEVAHNEAMPFVVKKGSDEVTVLGTHFNVHAYNDENEVKVTLLEGSVRVSQLITNDTRIIKPGQQVNISERPEKLPSMELIRNADIEKTMAWKNGIFNFEEEPITEIMWQVGRWYDAEIIYQDAKPEDLFSGIIKRDNNLSEVLKLLEKTKRVHFTIDKRKIIVTK